MANIILTSNAQFQPFSYQELAVPIMHQQQVHDAVAEEYDKLSSQADVLEAMAMRDGDSEAYRRYKAFSDSLRNAADRLYTNGLDSQTKLTMHGLKRAYNTEIVPIQHAWAKREQEAKIQQEAWLKNPDLMFSRNAGNTDLDYYMSNPEGGFAVYDKGAIQKEASAMFSMLANKIRSGETKDIDPFTMNFIQKYGEDPSLLSAWLQDPSISPTLTNMMNGILGKHGITVESMKNIPNGENILREGIAAAQSGVWSAIGKDTSTQIEKFKNREDYKHMLDLDKITKTAEAKGKDSPNDVKLMERGVGIETEDNYKAKHYNNVMSLVQGNRFAGKYFGAARDVNPMKLYEAYQEELKKPEYWDVNYYTYPTLGGGTTTPQKTLKNDAKEKAKKAVLNKLSGVSGNGYKFSDLGVTDIVSDEQYNTLKELGFTSSDDFATVGGEEIMNRLNNTAKRRMAYEIPMPENGYDFLNGQFRTQALFADDNDTLEGKVYEFENRKKGEGVNDLDDLGIKKKESDSEKIQTIGYDPRYPDMVLVRMTNGKEFLVDPQLLGGSTMSSYLSDEIARGTDSENIAKGFLKFINFYNQYLGGSSEKAIQ